MNAGAGDGDLLPRERFCAQASRFVQAVSDGVLLVDERGSIVLANSAAEALFGVSPGALTGQAIETLVPDEHRAAHAEHRRRYHERPAPRPMATVNTLLARRLDGRQFPADVSLSPMAGDGEGLTLACVRDMSWRERLRDDVRESERRYRMVVEQASEVFYRIALDGDPFRGRVEFVSPQCERLTGLPPEAFLANPARWVGLIHPEDLEALSRDTAALLSDGLERTRYYRLRNVDGEYRHVADRVVATLSEQGAVIGYQGVARDVTATVRAEQERQRLDERLRQAERMEALGRLAGAIAHDFNNILTVILGLCETAAIGLDPAGMARHDLDGIAAAGRRATDLTRQLLAFSRRQVITPQLVDMRAHLVSLEGMLRRAATEQIELRLNLAESLWPVLVDPTQIDQVLINLVANARDAMPHGGVVTVEASNVEVDDRAAAGQSGLARGHYVRLEVADNGAGMDEQTLKNVFVPFFTTKPDGAGTGLGLASVYGILKQNDGAVTVRSQLGRGTTVTVYWPRDDGAGPSAPAPAVVSPSAPSRRLTVLLVEDNDQVRIVVRRLLARLGHRVLEARSPSTAIALCETLGERGIDVLLTDVVMPEMNGLVLSERIRELQPTVVTVLMSGYPDGIARADTEARRSDVLFLAKPFDQTSLDATLRRALGGGVDHRPGTGPT